MKKLQENDIKSERTQSYFIEATKEIIMRDGVEGVSVRKIAGIAGYSYATLYNYFADLNQLLQETKTKMIHDIIAYMEGAADQSFSGSNAIKHLNHRYALYYLEHPHVFRFFYSYRLASGPKHTEQTVDFEASWRICYQDLVANGIIREEDVGIVAKTIIYALHGLLALYFSDNGITRELLFDELDHVTENLLKG